LQDGHCVDTHLQGIQIRWAKADKLRFAKSPSVYWQLMRLVARERVDIVNIPVERKYAPVVLFLFVLKLIFGFRLVSYCHPAVHSRGKRPTKLDLAVTRLVFRLFDRIIFYNERNMKWALSHRLLRRCQATFANNTLDTKSIWEGYSFEVNRSVPIRLLFIGRLIPSKRLDVLFDYFRALRVELPGLELSIIGSGPEQRWVNMMSANCDGVTWAGAITDEKQIARYMRQSHAVFLPGDSGLAIVHAFSYGKPFITIDAGEERHGPEIEYLLDGVNGLRLQNSKAENLKRIISMLTEPVAYEAACRSAFQTGESLRVENWCERFYGALRSTRCAQDAEAVSVGCTERACHGARSGKPWSGQELAGGRSLVRPIASGVRQGGRKLQPRLLVIGPYPPPFAGPEMAIKTTLQSPLTRQFKTKLLKTNVRTRNEEKGRIGITPIVSVFLFLLRLSFTLATYRPHIVYYFVTATRLGWIGRDVWCVFLSRSAGSKVVIHMRAGHFQHQLRTSSAVERAMIRLACSRTSSNLVQSESLRNQFDGLAPPERVHVVPNLIDARLYENGDLQECDRRCVLFLGHLSFAKGYCDLLAAIPKVARKFPEVRFQFAGAKIHVERNVFKNQMTGEPLVLRDPDECFDRYIRGKFERNYEDLGILGQQKKLEVLRRCNFLVLPSYSEGFSMATLEAMTMGKPVICTPVGGQGDYIADGKNGFLVPPGDVQSLARAMCRLLGDPSLRDEIARRNYEYSRANFAQERIGQRLAGHFRELLNGRPGGSNSRPLASVPRY
jgi:glycosyltransferase involved in cell wall biosynthesis